MNVMISYVDLNRRFVAYSDDTVGEITNMFDIDGDDTDDPFLCVSYVSSHPSGKWFSAPFYPDYHPNIH